MWVAGMFLVDKTQGCWRCKFIQLLEYNTCNNDNYLVLALVLHRTLLCHVVPKFYILLIYQSRGLLTLEAPGWQDCSCVYHVSRYWLIFWSCWSIFSINSACGRISSHWCLGKCKSMDARPAIRWCLVVCMAFLLHLFNGNVVPAFSMMHWACWW